jgi:hypothetical protein
MQPFARRKHGAARAVTTQNARAKRIKSFILDKTGACCEGQAVRNQQASSTARWVQQVAAKGGRGVGDRSRGPTS